MCPYTMQKTAISFNKKAHFLGWTGMSVSPWPWKPPKRILIIWGNRKKYWSGSGSSSQTSLDENRFFKFFMGKKISAKKWRGNIKARITMCHQISRNNSQQKKSGLIHAMMYTTSKRIELESPSFSGFKCLSICFKTWATGTF